jgi:hypothetical protein
VGKRANPTWKDPEGTDKDLGKILADTRFSIFLGGPHMWEIDLPCIPLESGFFFFDGQNFAKDGMGILTF